MAITTATLRVLLEDDVSPGARKVEAALDRIAVDAKKIDEILAKSGASDKFGAQLKRLGATVVEIEAATKAWENYAKAEGLAADRSKWTTEQAAQVRRWENATVGSVRAVMAVEKTLEEERGKAAAARARAIETERVQDEAAMRRRVETERRDYERLVERRAHAEEHGGFRNYALTTAAMAVSAHEIMHGIEAVMEQGAEYQHRLVALQNAGRTPDEIRRMSDASHAALRGVPTATLAGNLEILNETVGAFGSVEHAVEHLGFMAKAAAVLHATAGDKIGESAGQMGNALARFFEMRGTAGNSALFEREASEMMKSMAFTGGNVNPRELLNFAQQAKSSLQNYDLRFLSRIVPSIIGEVGGDRAGTQANAFNSVILGRARDKKQAAAWRNYGLINPAMMSPDGTGWTGGAIYHTDEFLRDPLAAGEKYVLPALKAHGVDIDNQIELTKALGTLFRNINAAAFANELWQRQNRNRLHKDEGYIGGVESPDELYKRLLKTDPLFALSALKGAFGSFLTTLSSPLMSTAASSLSGMAENLNQLAVVAHDHPIAATTAGLAAAAGSLYAAGKLSYGLINGFSGVAAMGPAAGEMVAAGHEQLAAGRIMTTAAEAQRVSALEHDIPGLGVGGKAGARAAVREGEVLAEGAAEAAIGNRVVAAIEGGLKGGVSVGSLGALEIAEAAGVTLTAGTVSLIGLTAAGIIGALKASMEPKHRAVLDPDYGNPFAPGKGIDLSGTLAAPEGTAGYPRGRSGSQADVDKRGHMIIGRGGVHEWVADDYAPLKRAPYFAVAPFAPDGSPLPSMPNYWLTKGGTDPTTGTRIGAGLPIPDPDRFQPPERYAPAGAALPPAPPIKPPEAPPVTPKVDTAPAEQGLMQLMNLSSDTGAKMRSALDITAEPKISTGSLDAYIAKLREAIALQGQLGAIGGGNGLGPGSVGAAAHRSFAPAPAGRLSV